MKVYTKKGDQGETSLIGGTRVRKDHVRIESYGTVDELNSWMGVLRDHTADPDETALILEIQDRLFTIGSHLASDPETARMKLPEVQTNDIQNLEDAMDRIDRELPTLRSFVLPGGHPSVSFCHVARCICRRAERSVIRLDEETTVDPLILQYLNRLSDYLFVLSRKLTQDTKAEEIPWNPNP